jgi:hypothetical protein
MDGDRSSISAMGTVRVSEVKFLSTHLNTLLASSARGPPAATGLPAAGGPASGRGRHLFLMKFARCTGPTSSHNKHLIVIYSGIYKK